jgi:hypothetical protein
MVGHKEHLSDPLTVFVSALQSQWYFGSFSVLATKDMAGKFLL